MTTQNEALRLADALAALECMDDYARMCVSVDPEGPYYVLRNFIIAAGRMQAENEELRKDAERYRMKRRIDLEATLEKHIFSDPDMFSRGFNASYDTAIDAAITKSKGGA